MFVIMFGLIKTRFKLVMHKDNQDIPSTYTSSILLAATPSLSNLIPCLKIDFTLVNLVTLLVEELPKRFSKTP